ncbi:MAG: zinc-binding dehydrogenase, partial [Gemmatimonadetes bacterium]|nr:zinc-binding dehydrogenase [Gemmatimonadota bacterium]
MYAAFFRRHGGPEVMETGEAPEPVAATGTVVVSVRAAALNHLDLWVRRGLPGLTLELPHIGGSDVAGVIDEIGPGVEGWEVGDRVALNPSLWCGECEWCERGEHPLCLDFKILGEHVAGGTAERVRVAARNLYRIPDDLEFRVAAAAPLAYQTAWRALKTRGGLKDGESLLVTGASGGVSTAAIQIARLLGARVLAVTSGPENVSRVRELGADVVFDRLETDFAEGVKEHTAGRGVNLVLDSVGEATWAQCLRSLSRLGRLVTYGATTGPRGAVEIRHMFWKQISVSGSTMASRSEFEAVMGHVAAGDLTPVIDDVMPLAAIREAHEVLEAGRAFGKLVLEP